MGLSRVEKINRSAGLAGNESIITATKLRTLLTLMFVALTAISIAMVLSEFTTNFEQKTVFGFDIYTIVMRVGLIIGIPLAWYLGFAKINEVKAFVFSRTWGSRITSALAGVKFLVPIVIINYLGVVALVDLTTRNNEAKVVNSEEYKKLSSVSNLFKTVAKHSMGNDFDALIEVQKNQKSKIERDRKKSIERYKNSNYDSSSKANNIHAVNKQYDKKRDRADERIHELTKLKLLQADKNEAITLNKAKEYQSSVNTALGYKAIQDGKNEENVKASAYYGYIVAIGGEIVDLLLALVIFLKIRYNDNNSDEVLVIQAGVNRKVMDTIEEPEPMPVNNNEYEEVETPKLKPLKKA